MALAIQMFGGGRRWFKWVASAALTGFRRVANLLHHGGDARPSPAKSKAAEKQRRKDLRRKLGV